MMHALLYHFLRDVPQAVAIWSALTVLAMVVIATLVGRRGPVPEPPPEPVPEAAGTPVGAAPEDLRRYAGEVAVAADRAAATARRRRAEWLAVQDAVESTGRQLDEADAEVRRLVRATAFGVPRTPRTPAEYADRERFLHRAAMAAYWRRELSVAELSDVFTHRNGWDPRRHPVEQELVLRTVVRDRLHARHRAAVQRERDAWRAAELSAVAARSLREEAFAAAVRAHRAYSVPVPGPAPDRTITAPVRRWWAGTRWRTVRAG
ncbi:hypothetical protein [Micromonospora echinofusca]|uniref:DUF4129 domain-containing protein n=1 Tax=Micromonospora echinofusca TaxID=47858 RepID=A0ABS3VWH9_MICEH|nr:hypothetical protein [Micromonospora echinofusca]MBO4208783.1 hypothetical protein [Micromonospora echinofusca]